MKDGSGAAGTIERSEDTGEDSYDLNNQCVDETAYRGKMSRITSHDEAIRSSETLRQSIIHNPREAIMGLFRFDSNRIAALMAGIAE
ncbi:MAG: hypothetical protein HQL06_10635 [Nitrospirae bacterium]|nr:hypothetical protein [Nitrospirota bacterium]